MVVHTDSMQESVRITLFQCEQICFCTTTKLFLRDDVPSMAVHTMRGMKFCDFLA